MKPEYFEFTGYHGTVLPAVLWVPEGTDPVGDGGKGVQRVYEQMKKAGIRNVGFRMFPHARHDLLHEEENGAQMVRQCIADWMM